MQSDSLLLCLLCLFLSVSRGQQITGAWRMTGFDSTGKSSSPYVGVSQNNAIIYQVDARPTDTQPLGLDDRAEVYPIFERPGTVVDTSDTAYFSSQTGYTAVLFNGTELWSFICPLASPNAWGTPALTRDLSSVIIVCSGLIASQVYLLETCNGSPSSSWAQPYVVASEVIASPIIDDDSQLVFVATMSGSVDAINIGLGTQNWTSPLGSPIQGTPCFDGTLLYVFTTTGEAVSLNPVNGVVVWSVDVNGGAPGFTSSCALQATEDGLPGSFVAAGAIDFNLYVLDTANGATLCKYDTGAAINQGVASMNSTFLVPSTNGTLTAVLPLPPLCLSVFQVDGLVNPSRPAFDGYLTAIVGTDIGLYSLNAKWIALFRHIWQLTVTGDAFDTPAIGPNGNIFVSSQQNSLFCVGVSADFLQQHTRVAGMMATAKLGDATSNRQLSFLCNTIMLELDQPYVTWINNGNISLALNETCSMLKLVAAGQDPYGGSPNYVYFQQPTSYISLLQDDLRQNLVDIDAQVTNLTTESDSIDQQLANMHVILDYAINQLETYEAATAQTKSLLMSLYGTILGLEVRLEVVTVLAEATIDAFLAEWLAEAAKFLKYALADDKKAIEEVKAAIGELGKAINSILNPFAWAFGGIKRDFKKGMADLKKAIAYIIESAFWADVAAGYLESWVELSQVNKLFLELVEVNTDIIYNNMTFSQALPAILKADIDISQIKGWLEYAAARMKHYPYAIASVINEYIADSQAIYTTDFAFYAVYNQYQSQVAQVNSMKQQIANIENAIAELTLPLAGIGAALKVAEAQQYWTQIQVIETARQACEQYLFWTLSACPSSIAIPAYPTVPNIDTFVTEFNQMVLAANQSVVGIMWAQITFNKTTNPEAFVNATDGIFNLAVYLPPNCSFYNVRTTEYRAYFLPLDSESSPVIGVHFSHAGLSEFVNENNQTFSFTHEAWDDDTPIYYANTEACPYSGTVCLAPQCGSDFNLSPYGLWTIQVNPSAFHNISAVESVRLQFNVWYQLPGGVPPAEFVLFGGGDGGIQVPADLCQTPP